MQDFNDKIMQLSADFFNTYSQLASAKLAIFWKKTIFGD